MPNDNDSFDSSDFSDEIVDDEFSDENVTRNKADEKEESNYYFDWTYLSQNETERFLRKLRTQTLPKH